MTQAQARRIANPAQAQALADLRAALVAAVVLMPSAANIARLEAAVIEEFGV